MDLSSKLMKNISKQTSGSALVLVLGVVAIVSALVVSLVLASKLERLSAFHYAERVRASFMAQEAVATSQMMLGAAFAKTNTQVASSPGKLIVRPEGTNAWTPVDLSSGVSASTAANDSVNLNRAVLSGDKLPIINPLGGEMRVKWVYVTRDGTRTSGSAPAYNATNPVVGRYAFWVDDETSRVNLNTAHRREDNGYVLSQVELSTTSTNVTSAMADAIKNSAVDRPFQSLGEAARVGIDVASVISTNRFNFTHYNRSSYLNPWGEPKIFLTTQISNLPPEIRQIVSNKPTEGYKYFIDILATNYTPPSTNYADPGTNSTLSTNTSINTSIRLNKVSQSLKHMTELLMRTNWPGYPGQSFAKKYKPGNELRIAQLALDIMEYVRCAETTNSIVPMLRVKLNNETNLASGFTTADTHPTAFLGTVRSPQITEVGLWIADEGNVATNIVETATFTNTVFDVSWKAQGRFELYLPANYGFTNALSLAGTVYDFVVNGASYGGKDGETATNRPIRGSVTITNGTNVVISPNDYLVITTPEFIISATNATNNTLPRPAGGGGGTRVRVYLRNSGNTGIFQDLAGSVSFPPDAAGTNNTLNNITSMEVDDPRLNKGAAYWVRNGATNTFGQPNSIWKQSPAKSPQQDRDSGGAFSDFSLSMPAPKGTNGIPLGRVSSVAELGRVFTGFDRSSTNSADNISAPWRTIRLQPTINSDTTIPDWMLLELFAAPVVPQESREPVVFSSGYQMGGQVNVNSVVAPFAGIDKKESLWALFGDNNHPAIPNILAGTRATGGRTFGSAGLLSSVGELAEIKGVSDGGEQSEANLRRIASQATTQSRTFRVFAVGESISQAPSGQITVHASRTVEALLAPVPGASPVVFKPVTWQMHSL
jgi:hypothetical protein